MPDSAQNSPGQSTSMVGCPIFLSERQAEVLSLAALGHTDKAIARLIKRSPRMVRQHLQRVRAKLGVGNTTHAVAIAVAVGLIRVDISALEFDTDPTN